MKSTSIWSLVGVTGLLAFGGLGWAQHRSGATPKSPRLAHVQNSFELLVHAAYPEAARLFGPQGERAWSRGRWNPQFLYPEPAQDVQGAVFTVEHGGQRSLWINTVMSVPERHFQYVYLQSDVLLTTIDVRFLPVNSGNTRVAVTYSRTALTAAANEHVRHLGQLDRLSGPEWERDVNSYLAEPKPDRK